ncbi:MAG TPA: alpha/beta fold hydrolase [Gaiellaceae bacterium]
MQRAAAPLLGVLVLVLSLASAGNGATTRPALHPCKLGGVAAQCGTLIVPENRTQPSGRRISLSFAVIKTRHATAKEPLFYFAGGPGGSALGVAKFASQVFGRTGRDLVLLDQRGVGASAPLLCPEPPPNLAIGSLRSYARDCVANLRADSRRYGTDAAMDDADSLRAALGYQRVVVYGGSYGATAALVYIARHGSHVKAAILDGATSPDVPFFELAPQAGQAQIRLLS